MNWPPTVSLRWMKSFSHGRKEQTEWTLSVWRIPVTTVIKTVTEWHTPCWVKATNVSCMVSFSMSFTLLPKPNTVMPMRKLIMWICLLVRTLRKPHILRSVPWRHLCIMPWVERSIAWIFPMRLRRQNYSSNYPKEKKSPVWNSICGNKKMQTTVLTTWL